MSDDTVITTLQASAPRRLFAYGAVFALGALLVLLAFFQPPAFGWQLFLIALGAATLVLAERLRRSSRLGLILTETDLRDTSGVVLTTLDNVKGVDRGALAFKPSNGFVLRLKTPQERSWVPGLWWRYSKRIGVGGVTPSGASKFMAEQIAMRIDND